MIGLLHRLPELPLHRGPLLQALGQPVRKGYKTWGRDRVIISGVVAMSTVASLSTGALALANDQAQTPRWEMVSEQLTDVPRDAVGVLSARAPSSPRPMRCGL